MCCSNTWNLSRDFSLTETNGFISKPSFTEKLTNIVSINRHREAVGPLIEDTAATRIQTAFMGFKVRKFYCNSKPILRLKILMGGDYGKKANVEYVKKSSIMEQDTSTNKN
ncbi:putative IQ motif, EF-hand binding protein [Helianthus annuus]|nr:putative IQ motif, EF-hand binding protein [Helianthus annuus]